MTKEEYNAYMRLYFRRRYQAVKNKVLRLLGSKCVKCGSRKKLEIDHISRKSKKYSVTNMYLLAWEKIVIELKKCQILCKRCHIEKTILERGNKIAKGAHGTISSYAYCKCELCREAKSRSNKEYRLRYTAPSSKGRTFAS